MQAPRLKPSSLPGCLFVLVLGALFLAGGGYLLFDGDETAPHVYEVFLADLNGDGHLDAFVVFLNELHKVLLNDGGGRFTVGRQLLMHDYVLALGDIDGDGQVDAVLSQFDGGGQSIACKTDAPGLVSGNRLNASSLEPFAIRDANGDGSPEAYIAGCCRRNATLISYGEFAGGYPCLGMEAVGAAALADLNGDHALDAFLAKGWVAVDGKRQSGAPDEVWFNDGQGNFYDSGQRLGGSNGHAVKLGDVNADGFPDAVVGNQGPDEIWLNDGRGNFIDSRQRLGSGLTHAIYLADLDGDSDPDLFAGAGTSGRVWTNDGAGNFRPGQRLRFARETVFTLGDVNGDAIVDVFVAGVDFYQVWQGEGDGRFTAGLPTGY